MPSAVPTEPGIVAAAPLIASGIAASARATATGAPVAWSAHAAHFSGTASPSQSAAPIRIIVPRWQIHPSAAE